MASPLDNLARALAQPMSRRHALRLAAAAAATSFFGLPGGRARAGTGCPPPDVPSFTQSCGQFFCCHPTAQCCTYPDGRASCCIPDQGYTCGPETPDRHPACKCINDCGGACCKPDEKCVDPDQGLCCKVGCGKECCQSGEKCVDPRRGVCCKSYEKGCIGDHATICCDEDAGQCCAGSEAPRLTSCCGVGQTCDPQGFCKCKRGRTIDCGDDCCKKGDKCCPGITRMFCTPKQNKCCGDTVAFRGQECCAGRFPYDPRTERCCGVSGVCPSGAECCPDGCCPPRSSCCTGGCCNLAGKVVGPKRAFARPPDRRTAIRRRSQRHGTRRRAGRL